MNVAYNVTNQTRTDDRADGSGTPLGVLRYILLPLSLILWGIGLSQTNINNLDPYGLPGALSPIFYVGLGLLIVSAGIEFSRRRLSPLRLSLHAVALVVILYGTAPIIYQEGRYAWLYKTIGVTQYVGAHGSLDRTIDIYQNWPGFFALAAWFDKVSGAGNPLDYAKWAQLVFELAAIPLLYTIYHSLFLPVWHRWFAIMLYAASNWIAQDYYSPQGMSTLLALGIMALVTRWMFVVTSERRQRDTTGASRGRRPEVRPRDTVARELRRSGPFIIALAALFFVLTASHELSPYIVTIQIAALAITGLARPRWIALVVAAIAIGYLLPNFTYVNDHYGLTTSLGSFFNNVQPPSTSSGSVAPIGGDKFIADCTRLLSVGIWLLAIVGAWRQRKSRRIVLALLLLTFTPILVLLGGAYGNEGLLRVYLFSLPWAVTLCASALAPLRNRAKEVGYNALLAVIPLIVAVTLFFPSFFGNDQSSVMTASEVNTTYTFFQKAKPGSLLTVIGNAPVSDTADYNDFPVGIIFGDGGIMPGGYNVAIVDVPAYLARTMERYSGNQPAYIVMTPSMSRYNLEFGVTAQENITALLAALAKSRYWTLVASNDGTEIYQLSQAARTMPSGDYSKTVNLAVP
jgi:hypothetical protein